MLTTEEINQRQQEAAAMIENAGLLLTSDEKKNIEIADFGLSEFTKTGLGVFVYVNTDRCCAKELAMWPRQTCPEHLHPTINGEPGKEETFRCRAGKVFLYVSGEATPNPQSQPPAGREDTYTVWHEIALSPGEQYTIYPDTPHWFQAGDEGAVISEFSTRSTDELDVFTDKEIGRFTKVADE
jgi:D-lyxose ketol-isomerase